MVLGDSSTKSRVTGMSPTSRRKSAADARRGSLVDTGSLPIGDIVPGSDVMG
jgi:hypothetical protein